MTIRDIVIKEQDILSFPLPVDERTIINLPDEGETDIFTGAYLLIKENDELSIESLDGDTYSLDDEYYQYAIKITKEDRPVLVCWYKSED